MFHALISDPYLLVVCQSKVEQWYDRLSWPYTIVAPQHRSNLWSILLFPYSNFDHHRLLHWSAGHSWGVHKRRSRWNSKSHSASAYFPSVTVDNTFDQWRSNSRCNRDSIENSVMHSHSRRRQDCIIDCRNRRAKEQLDSRRRLAVEAENSRAQDRVPWPEVQEHRSIRCANCLPNPDVYDEVVRVDLDCRSLRNGARHWPSDPSVHRCKRDGEQTKRERSTRNASCPQR